MTLLASANQRLILPLKYVYRNALKNINRSALASPAGYAALHTESKEQHFDVTICGGGLVGATLAAALAKNPTFSDKQILVLERTAPFKRHTVDAQYGKRVSAINNSSIELFKSIGIWEHMSAARVKPVKQMQVWDASSDALIHFQHDNFCEDIACIIENDLMLDAAYDVLSKSENVCVRNSARIDKLQIAADDDSVRKLGVLDLKDGERFTCDLLVGADGPNSTVRKAMNIDVYTLDYDSRCVVANLELQEAGDNAVAWQRFLPTGPIAMLPLSESMSSLVWSTTKDHARELLNLPAEDFVNAVNEAFFKEYQKNDVVVKALQGLNAIMGRNPKQMLHQYPPRVCGLVEKTIGAFPIRFLHASSYVCTGTALIGDACHRIHPLAGQGVNLGFSDVRFLIDVLAEAAYAGGKLGDVRHLIKYEQKCLAKNVPILIGVHGLHSLYSTTFSPIVLLRSLGLQFTDNVSVIKNIFMKRAMG